MSSRVVITGIGVVSSIGVGKDAFWENLTRGKSGISEISVFDTTDYPTHLGGQIKDFRPQEFISEGRLKKLGRAAYQAVAAAGLALKDASFKPRDSDPQMIGVIIGTTMAETQVFEELNSTWIKQGLEAVDAEWLCQIPAFALSANVAAEFGFRGPNYVIPTACSAGNYSIGYAYDLLRSGAAQMMLAGGSDAFSRIAFTGFNRLLSIAPEKCQPFDKNRKGMMVGEGAAVLLLETLEGALKRKAPIFAEVLGYGLSCDARHMTAPHAEGIAMAMEKAISAAGLSLEEIDYISAHGTGTPANDREESAAIKQVFGGLYKKVAVSSIKSMLGHTMGAASAIEAAACCLAIKHNLIPPTINYETPDPECDIDCVPNTSRSATVKVALNNSSAFGGNNACLVLAEYN